MTAVSLHESVPQRGQEELRGWFGNMIYNFTLLSEQLCFKVKKVGCCTE